jgi:lysophospholipase L1-like esterase
VLQHANAQVSDAVARRLGLPRRAHTRLVERDDGGPPLRIPLPGRPRRSHAPDPGMVQSVELDPEGFCNPPPRDGGPARADVVALGDSFTYCTTVAPDETWSALLARETGLAVRNLGVGGIGLHESLQILLRFGLADAPRSVILNAYEGNDLRDALAWAEHRDGRPPDAYAGRAARTVLDSPLGARSWAVNLLAGGALVLRDHVRDPDRTPPASRTRNRDVDFRYRLELPGASVAFNPENGDRDEVVQARLLERGEVDLSLFDPPLARFAALAREHGFAPVVAYTPSAPTVYAEWVRFADPSIGPPLAAASAAQRAWLARRCAELGLRFVDLTEALRAAAREARGRELLYFPTNLHLTQAGHRVVAERLAEVVAPPSE